MNTIRILDLIFIFPTMVENIKKQANMIIRTILVVALFASQSSFAKETYSLPRISQQPTIDGLLDHNEWASATQIQLVFDINSGDNTPAPVQTDTDEHGAHAMLSIMEKDGYTEHNAR